MYDLNKEIAGWKSSVSRQRACSRDELNELESHLREEIDVLIGQGVTESEAFAEAVARMGAAEKISDEFAKDGRLMKNSIGGGVIVSVIMFSVLFSGFPLYGGQMDFVGCLGVAFGHGFGFSCCFLAMSNKRKNAPTPDKTPEPRTGG